MLLLMALGSGGGIVDLWKALEDVHSAPSAEPIGVPDLVDPRGASAPSTPVPASPRSTPTWVRLLSVIWALIPIATLGWGAPFSFTYAAIRLHSRALGLCAGAYGVAAIVSFYLAGNNNDNSWQSNAGAAMAIVTGMVATAHAFAIRRALIAGRVPEDPAVTRATERLRVRENARRILVANPSLAEELQIGRPDRCRDFDDGGLVDVNHVPFDHLVALPGIGETNAERIVSVRDQIGGFTSVDDLSITLGLHPHDLDRAADRIVFIR